jgi:hypothetical protein
MPSSCICDPGDDIGVTSVQPISIRTSGIYLRSLGLHQDDSSYIHRLFHLDSLELRSTANSNMSEIQRRIATITSAYITRQTRRGQLPREPTATEIRRLQTWLFLFFLNRDLQTRFEQYLGAKARRNRSRRQQLGEDLRHHDAHLDIYEDPALQVRLCP